ncbi:MAG: DUF86 domain-containing protein [Nitrospirae bacterium]|nr:DUF86 domain-containing protein [Nitrospirota bacterium]
MAEFEIILKNLFAVISERVNYLKEMANELPNISSLKKADHKYKSAIERDLQVAIEACIDIGKVIISEKKLRPPESMKDVCVVLFENGFIDKRMLHDFERMVGARNIIVHRYEKIDLEIIYGILKRHLNDFQKFIKQISKKTLEKA